MKTYITKLKRIGCTFYFLCAPVCPLEALRRLSWLDFWPAREPVNMIQQKPCEKAVASCQNFYYQWRGLQGIDKIHMRLEKNRSQEFQRKKIHLRHIKNRAEFWWCELPLRSMQSWILQKVSNVVYRSVKTKNPAKEDPSKAGTWLTTEF